MEHLPTHYREFEISDFCLGGRSGPYYATHPDYDGPEDNRCFASFSLADLFETVDAWYEDQMEDSDAREGHVEVLDRDGGFWSGYSVFEFGGFEYSVDVSGHLEGEMSPEIDDVDWTTLETT